MEMSIMNRSPSPDSERKDVLLLDSPEEWQDEDGAVSADGKNGTGSSFSLHAFLKGHIPSIISVLSVITNVVVIAYLIPELRHDITFMQGQTESMQSTLDSWQSTVLQIEQQISGAEGDIKRFHQTFNKTEARVIDFQEEVARTSTSILNRIQFQLNATTDLLGDVQLRTTQMELRINQSASEFNLLSEEMEQRRINFTAQLNSSISQFHGEAVAVTQMLLSERQATVLLLQQLHNDSMMAIEELLTLNQTLSQEVSLIGVQYLNEMSRLNQTVSEEMEGRKAEFVNVIIPHFVNQMESLNVSTEVWQLTSSVAQLDHAVSTLSATNINVSWVALQLPITSDGSMHVTQATEGLLPGSSFSLNVRPGDVVEIIFSAAGAAVSEIGATMHLSISMSSCDRILQLGGLGLVNGEQIGPLAMTTFCQVPINARVMSGGVQVGMDSSTETAYLFYPSLVAKVIGRAATANTGQHV